MNITDMLLTPNKYSRPQTPLKLVKQVVVHYTGNPMSTAKNNRDYFESLKAGRKNASGNFLYVSSHYLVGLQGEIIRNIPEREIAYCSNSANGYSISIETCHPDTTGKFYEVTEQALVELVADICKRHRIDPLKDVIRHYDVTGKACPLWYVSHEDDWARFKNMVSDMINGKQAPKPQPKQGYYRLGLFDETTKEQADVQKIVKLMKATGRAVDYVEIN